MKLPKGATVAVADGEKLRLFRNGGDEGALALSALPDPAIGGGNAGSGSRHQSSSANHDHGQSAEDGYAAGTAAFLNRQVMDKKIDALVVIAAPRTLGELRKHYHKQLEGVLLRELAKDLTGHSLNEISTAVEHA